MLRYLTTLVFLIKMRLYFSFIARVNNVFLTEDCYDKNLSIFLLSFISSFCFPERKPGKTMSSLHTPFVYFPHQCYYCQYYLDHGLSVSNHKIFCISQPLSITIAATYWPICQIKRRRPRSL